MCCQTLDLRYLINSVVHLKDIVNQDGQICVVGVWHRIVCNDCKSGRVISVPDS